MKPRALFVSNCPGETRWDPRIDSDRSSTIELSPMSPATPKHWPSIGISRVIVIIKRTAQTRHVKLTLDPDWYSILCGYWRELLWRKWVVGPPFAGTCQTLLACPPCTWGCMNWSPARRPRTSPWFVAPPLWLVERAPAVCGPERNVDNVKESHKHTTMTKNTPKIK